MKNTVFLGKVYHENRETNDFYATNPKAIDLLLKKVKKRVHG